MQINQITDIPGPRSQAVIANNKKYRFPKSRMTQFVAKSGKGAFQEDEDGNVFLDFSAGIAVVNTSHGHSKVVEAIQNQAAQLVHTGPFNFSEVQVALAEKLATITPGKDQKRVFFTNSGTESVEAAIKMARYSTKRHGIVSFLGGFHGRSYGAMSISSSKSIQRKSYAPLVGGTYHAYFPTCYRCPINLKYPQCNIACLDYIENTLFQKIIPPDEVAAFLVEPIQGEGGYIVPPDEFHPKLKALAEKYNILYIADEVQTGVGRTGKMFASQWWNVSPDIICLAKGIASGMPLGAIAAKDSLFAWEADHHGSTFGGNLVSCAAALATVEIIEEEGLCDHAHSTGNYIMEKLVELKSNYEIVGDVRGKGLMIGIEIVENKDSKKQDKEKRDQIILNGFEKGLLIIPCGENIIRICPPLAITKEEVDTGLKLLETSIQSVNA